MGCLSLKFLNCKMKWTCFHLMACVVIWAQQTDAFLYRVSNRLSKESVCYTNNSESAVVLVPSLNDLQEEHAKPDWKSIRQTSQLLKDFNCDLSKSPICKTWSYNNDFEVVSNLKNGQDQFEPITDIRWKDLPVALTHGQFDFTRLSRLPGNNGIFQLSILANSSASILITQDDSLKSGYRISFDGWNNSLESRIAYCNEILSSETPNCETIVHYKSISQPILDRGRQWVLIKLKYTMARDSAKIYVSLPSSNTLLTSPSTNSRVPIKSGHWNVAVTSFDSIRGLFRIHEYKYLQPIRDKGSMSVSLQVSKLQEMLCFDVIYISNEVISVRLVKEKVNLKNFTIPSSEGRKKWSTHRMSYQIDWTGNLTIIIETTTASTYIGGVFFCDEGPVISSKGKSEICQDLSLSNISTAKNNSNIMKFPDQLGASELLSLCSNVGEEVCQNVDICDSKGCICMFGLIQQNSDICKSNCRGYYCQCQDLIKVVSKAHSAQLNFSSRCNDAFGGIDLIVKYGKMYDYANWISVNLSRARPVIEIDKLEPKAEYVYEMKIHKDRILYKRFNSLLGFGSFITQKCKSINGSNVNIWVSWSTINVTASEDSELCHLDALEIQFPNGTKHVISLDGKKVISEDFKFEADMSYIISVVDSEGQTVTKLQSFKISSDTSHIFITYFINASGALCVFCVLALSFFAFKKYKNRNEGTANNLLEMTQSPKVEINEPVALSKIIKVSDFEEYVEKATKTDLLKRQHELAPRGQTLPWLVGNDPTNKKKNRYNNLMAYDATRVVLEQFQGGSSDYINASYIDGYKKPRAYIATQAPKKQTVVDFWQMIWQENVPVIVMLTNLIESNKVKCEKYWPDLQKSIIHGSLEIQNDIEEIFSDFIVRTLNVSQGSASRTVVQMHYTGWPEEGVPFYPQSVATFAAKIANITNGLPIVVHCCSGISRTGVIVLVDVCIRMARAEGSLDIAKTFGEMRSQRVNFLDKQCQYEFAHLVLLEALVMPHFSIACENFQTELKDLFSQNYTRLSKQYNTLNEICEREWKRSKRIGLENDMNDYQDVVSTPAQLVQIYQQEMNTRATVTSAVYVDGFKKNKQFIATKMPKAEDVEIFWKMVQQHKSEQIFILNNLLKEQESFLTHSRQKFEGFSVVFNTQFKLQNCAIKKYTIESGAQNSFMVNVLCFNKWAPTQIQGPKPSELIELWEETELARRNSISIVVCNDGITACGLFISAGFVVEKIKMEHEVDVALAVRILRKSRPKFIASLKQYEALHLAAQAYLQNFDNYGNFDGNFEPN
ncbi:receptor-type tyrosine-protein phosphatase alpha-like [Neocloeon triangulifer]|uniref:receptor-type tyrosine-protein phosphatase alpha-like n=1 Tax=Neocloeon triangulifer TaxID=2078957 RepID=UPI00286F42DF|nr:receptor-type tyrosine-protein phosphatase alpha-like [Neocloeon triangulifer]